MHAKLHYYSRKNRRKIIKRVKSVGKYIFYTCDGTE